MTIALKPVSSNNPKAPRFEIHALTPARKWIQVGALFELFSNNTGEAFLNGKIDDPSMNAPLQISAFQQDDGSYNIVWSRPTRRRDVTAQLAAKQDDMPAFDMGEGPTGSDGAITDGLGESTAEFAS